MAIDNKIRDEKLQYEINRKVAKISALLLDIIGKYSPLGKSFEKQTKMIEEQGRKQMDAIMNQNERLMVTNKDDHENNYKEIFEGLVKERFNEIKELTDISQNDLIYYFKSNTDRKRLNDFNNDI